MSTSDKGWEDYWQHDGDGGEVFVNAKGERHPALAEYWQSAFSGLPADARVIDLASGAGSIFAHLGPQHGLQLHAADISAEALQVLAQRIPDVETTVCSADAVPFDDGSFELVVSQFGVEYAGIEAFSEAARLLAPGGRMNCLCHVEDGYIDSNNKAQLEQAMYMVEAGFIGLCTDLTKAGYSGDVDARKSSEAAFVPVAEKIATGMKICPGGIHSHLLLGFRQLFERRRAYDEADITDWLEQMRGELDKNIGRLTRMRAAASSQEDTVVITEKLQAAGLQEIQFELFKTPGNELPVAWKVSARRPA